jgi:hypothetical protein
MPYVFWEDNGSRRAMELVANRSSITRTRGALGIGADVFAGAARSFRSFVVADEAIDRVTRRLRSKPC